MRKLTLAALAGLTIAGAGLAGCASDPYYDGPSSRYASNRYAANRYDPYYDSGYYGPAYRPGYTYDNSAGSVALSVLGSLLGTRDDYGRVPVDQFGPNPDGMIGPDGHRIRCRLKTSYDSYYRQRITRRVCR